MSHLGETYYVALLSAAELHGAAHNRPQSFQVMVKTNRRPLHCGKVHVEFIARKDLELIPVIEMNTPRGVLRVASAEATALELVGYADRCGGLDHVASVLAELAEALDPQKLLAVAARCPIVWAQRLGYLLDVTTQHELGDALEAHVRKCARVVAPLVRSEMKTGAERLDRWRLAINASV